MSATKPYFGLQDALAVQERATADGVSIDADDAEVLFRHGRALPGLRVHGRLQLQMVAQSVNSLVVVLPENLHAEVMDLSSSQLELSPGLHARQVTLHGAKGVGALPNGWNVRHLDLSESDVETIPSDLRVEFKLNLSGCPKLRTLPAGLKAGSLVLRDCANLEALPEEMDVSFLDISGCNQLRRFPATGRVRVGNIVARDCANLASIPAWLAEISVLDLRNCAALESLPDGLKVRSWIDVAGTRITELPPSLQDAGLRWRGVPISHRVVFRPETITADEVIREKNAEIRRVMLDRMGFERFLSLAGAVELDRDRDAGGERRLLFVDMPGDENLVCVSFICPSTNRQYVMRVPPAMKTCRQAVAWMAGFDDPAEYAPAVET